VQTVKDVLYSPQNLLFMGVNAPAVLAAGPELDKLLADPASVTSEIVGLAFNGFETLACCIISRVWPELFFHIM
jgi:hypothetical protein